MKTIQKSSFFIIRNRIIFFILFLFCFLSNNAIGQNLSSKKLIKIVKSTPDSIGTYAFDIVDYFNSFTEDKKELIYLFNYWIYENIQYDLNKYVSNDRSYTNIEETLKSKKTMCQGYSELFSELCFWADIECEIIIGYAKGVEFNGEPFNRTNHVWNSVLIDNNWRIVDVTWAIGVMKYKKNKIVFEKKRRDEYIFADPNKFILTHFPINHKWQLLLNPITYNEFLKKSPPKKSLNKKGKDVDLSLKTRIRGY